MNEAIDFLAKLGPNGLLAGAVVVVWLEYKKAKAELAAEQRARLEDAKMGTTQLLSIAEKVHAALDGIDTLKDRSSR